MNIIKPKTKLDRYSEDLKHFGQALMVVAAACLLLALVEYLGAL